MKFSTKNITETSFSTYDLDQFNGVDYTTTPTNVNDNRAIDCSNYMPNGNALVKRYGWEKYDYTFILKTNPRDEDSEIVFDEEEIDVDILDVIHYRNIKVVLAKYKKTNTTYQAWFYESENDFYEISNLNVIRDEDGVTTSIDYKPLRSVMYYDTKPYNYHFEKDGYLFLFTMGEYYRIDNNFEYKKVSDIAYVPTVVIGMNQEESTAKSNTRYEEFNMLSNKFKVKINLDFTDGKAYKDSTTNKYYWMYECHFDFSSIIGDLKNVTLSKVGKVSVSIAGHYADLNWYGLLESNGTIQEKILGVSYDTTEKRMRAVIQWYPYSSGVDPEDITDYKNTTFKKLFDTKEECYSNGSREVELEFEYDNTEVRKTILGCRFGTFYGADTYRDMLFMAGNKNTPNVDYHTNTPMNATYDWEAYTYFGDMSFHSIGSSSSAIIGYGINSDSSLTIFKENVGGEPNVWFRDVTWKYDTTTIGDYVINTAYLLDKVFPSAINLKCNVIGQAIQYDNALFFNTEDGIYKIQINNSSAVSSYNGVEVSYLIRNNLGNKISNSCSVVYDGKLFICREDKNGKKRVYLCDKNRYTYNNSEQVYEWWALDNIEADKMYEIDNELYFSNSNGLYVFNKEFVDYDYKEYKDITIGGTYSTTNKMFFNSTTDKIIYTLDNNTSIINSTDPKSMYQDFLDYSYFTLGSEILVVNTKLLSTSSSVSNGVYTLSFEPRTQEEFDLIINLIENGVYYNNANESVDKALKLEIAEYYYSGTNEVPCIRAKSISTKTKVSTTNGWVIGGEVKFKFKELYYDTYNIKNCYLNESNKWVYVDAANGVYTELGSISTIKFNQFDISIKGVTLDFEPITSTLSNVTLYTTMPVKSYWLGKYNALSRIDYLKTATNIYFVPDTRRGGYTRIGYRTHKKDVGYYSNSKGNSLDFNDINFDDFTFGQTEFGRTYSSKKKIKNFAFIQLKFYSNDSADSTLVSCTFRYKYSKNNRGVK